MTLHALQSAFRAEIAAGDDGLPPSSRGMAIYRDAYRGRLVAALGSRFERTRRWAGESSFTAAACHYVLAHPPAGWTLDDYGRDFPEILTGLFRDHPEVAELAWLEWHMSEAFAAPDRPTLDAQSLAAAGLAEADWEALSFSMAAGFAGRPVATNCTELFALLTRGEAEDFLPSSQADCAVIVWRRDLAPPFRVTDGAEHRALDRIGEGATLGAIGADVAPEQLGTWLAQWLGEGIFSGWAVRR